ncbi:MAG: flagellar hook-associated protein 2 [Candidatus Endobugula sp.]|jgi:flagellar hook-associated protein 2
MSQNIVSALGAGSGIDTTALVSSLVDIERLAPQGRIDTKRTTTETQISDFGLLSSALSVLQDAAVALNSADTFNSKAASFTDSSVFVPVSLDPEAQVGDYSFAVTQLAQAQSLSSSALFTAPTNSVGEGTLTFDFGSWDVVVPPANPATFSANSEVTSQVITIDGSNNTLNGLAKAINDADFGVQASIVNDGNGYRLITRAASGLDTQLQITAAESGGSPTNTDNAGLSRFAFNASAFQMTQNQLGQDSELTVNGLQVTRDSNTIDDVIDGFEFTISGLTEANESVNVSIDEDKSAGETAVRDFFTAYNTFLEVLEPITGYNLETEDYGSLAKDSLAKNIPTQIRQLLVGTVTGLDSTFTSLTNVGIRTELDGTLSIDEDDFSAALADNYDLFKQLFIPVSTSSNDQITVNSTGTNTTAGEYAVVITQVPTQGNVVGTDMADDLIAELTTASTASAVLTGAAPTAVLADFVAGSGDFTAGAAILPLDLATQSAGATDYDFSITVDGVASAANISLPVADYVSYAAMATALETAVNGDANISDVTVAYDTDHFVLTSSTTGAASSVALTAVGGSADDLGISTGTATAGTGGATDYDFTLEIDGTTSGTISITPGTYATFDDLATHLTTQINADATLTIASASVTVTHNGSAFVVTSDATGSSSTIDNATLVGSEAASLGMTTGTAVQGGTAPQYDFSIDVNGTTSGTISISAAVYADKDALATEIQSQINADSLLTAAGTSVNVTYDSGSDSFTIESRLYGSSSTVSVTNIGASAADLGLGGGASTTGINVAGTIDGVAGFGTGNVLLPALGEDGESMGLIIGESATSATVNFSRGFGGQLERLIEVFLENTGVISLREDSLSDNLEGLEGDQENLDRRIESYRERLTSQFIAMEAIVRSLQDSGAFLESTLENLLNANNNN